MALVLSKNPFCEPEAEAPPSIYQPIWESEHCSKSCVSTPSPPGGDTQGLREEPHYRRVPDHVMNRVAMSRISYFKRKFVDDEEPVLSFRSYCHTVSPVLEERANILRLSLEKLRFMDDPESFLRRSVLINNLLRRLRNEILLQSDWCFPSGQTTMPCPLQTPATQNTPLPSPALQPCMTPPGSHRKRLRLMRREGQECVPACCCLYAAGRYLQLPLSVYERDVYSNSRPSSSSSSSSSVRFPQLREEEEEEDSDEEEGSVSPMVAQDTRDQNRTSDGLRPQSHRDDKSLEKDTQKGKERVRGGEVSQRWLSDTIGAGHHGALARAHARGK
ncbi:SERTA domain-containing protein 4 isoform X2 [Pimephales promelas]|uniref:SERTA domain-containing protein 4 isoform X2 n=1 Tax=Pimephales promelas TaxID=90988 RepID=UPI001955A377|nr:SERTA domain-containing protein 4 isoform X2 [Pimephales promelas]KAG1950366.1 SERTA domain-containing protein [Pimephales promelas]